MSYDSDRSGATVGIAVAVALIVVVFGFILVAGAGLFLFRATASRESAMFAREQALQQQARAETEARQVAAKIQTEVEAVSPVATVLTITLDESGNIQLNGVPTELDQLRQELEDQQQHVSEDLSVIVAPVAECTPEQVTRVVSLCLEAGVADIRIDTLK